MYSISHIVAREAYENYMTHTLWVANSDNEAEINAKHYQIDKLFEQRINDLTQSLAQAEETVRNLKNEMEQIPADKGIVLAGRFIRSLGLIALYTLGIITVIPALVAVGMGLNANKMTDVKVFEIAHKYITLKSQKLIQAEDNLEKEKDIIEEFRNLLDLTAKINHGDVTMLKYKLSFLPNLIKNPQATVEKVNALNIRIIALRKEVGLSADLDKKIL